MHVWEAIRKAPGATLLFIISNVIVFFYTIPNLHDAASVYGISLNSIEKGYFFVFFTYMFLHASIVHLLINMFFLGDAGLPYEKRIGAEKFIAIYLLSGLSGAIFTTGYLLAEKAFGYIDLKTTIGASGAIFGVISYILARRDGMERFLKIYVPVIAALHIPAFLGDMGGTIAWHNHLGGITAGAFLSRVLRPRRSLD